METAPNKDSYGLLGSTDKPVTASEYLYSGDDSVKSSRLFGDTIGVTYEETDSLNFMAERRLVQNLWLREHVNSVLAAKIRCLVIMAMIHYLWLLLLSSFCTRSVVSTTSTDQVVIEGDVTSAEGRLLLEGSPASRPFTGGSNDSLCVLVDSGLYRNINLIMFYFLDCETVFTARVNSCSD